MKKIIKDWFTGIDGKTYDPARFLWFVGAASLILFAGMDVYFNKKIDLGMFAMAYAGLLAAGAAGVKIKETTEPNIYTPPKQDTPEN